MWYNYAKRTNKYNAKSTAYNGKVYHSKLEASYAMEFDMRVAAGELTHWKGQVPFKFYLVKDKKGWYLTDQAPNGKRNIFLCTYYLDFVGFRKDGMIELTEVKGMSTKTWETKWKYLCALYEDKPNYILEVKR